MGLETTLPVLIELMFSESSQGNRGSHLPHRVVAGEHDVPTFLLPECAFVIWGTISGQCTRVHVHVRIVWEAQRSVISEVLSCRKGIVSSILSRKTVTWFSQSRVDNGQSGEIWVCWILMYVPVLLHFAVSSCGKRDVLWAPVFQYLRSSGVRSGASQDLNLFIPKPVLPLLDLAVLSALTTQTVCIYTSSTQGFCSG